MFIKLLVLLNFVLYDLAIGKSCIPRDYGNGASVCVCNNTYCDDLQPIKKTAKGIITLYESSKSGDRFKESQLKFGTTNGQQTHSQTITIDRGLKYQKIIGFGGAFTDSAGINVKKLPESMQTQVLENYFSEKGIEYTIGRIPIAGSDFSTRPYSYCDEPNDDELRHFSLTEEDLIYKIPYIKLAQKLSSNKMKLFGSPWSSPAWMKTTQSFGKGGVLIGEPGGKYYQIWANYFVKFLDAYKYQNISLWGLTVENEPDNGFKHLALENRFNDLGFTPQTQRDFIKYNLGPALEKAGYGPNHLKLMIFDGEKRSHVYKWAETILNDKESAKYVSGLGFHWYENTDENMDILDKTNQKYPNLFLLSTEACAGWQKNISHVSLGNWTNFEKYAYDIITDLNHWSTGWTDWNLFLDTEGGPNWVNNFVDAPIIINITSYEYYKQPLFYALGHFSKFLSPDSVRVKLTEKSKITGFETTAFVRPDNATVVIALNMNAESVLLTVEDPIDGKISNVVNPHSMQSFIWYN